MTKPVDYFLLTERTCSRCKVTKPVAEFNRYADPTAAITGWRYHSWCRDCARQGSQRYGAENRDRRNERLRQWRRDNPEKAHELDRRRRLRRYGLNNAQVAEATLRQGGRCALCRRKKADLVVDHDHATGRVRGLLCGQCNTLLGWYEKAGVRSRVEGYLSS